MPNSSFRTILTGFLAAYLINCDNTQMNLLFSDFDTSRLIRGFSAISGVTITPDDTLIVLDEVQEVPLAITALKYFQENAPDYLI